MSDVDLAKSKILVTGGTGFIGRHLVTALSDLGADVYVLTRALPVSDECYSKKVNYICADLLNKDSLATKIPTFDIIYYLACEDFSKIDHISPEETIAYQGMINLYQSCGTNSQKFIYVSSVKALGESTQGMAVETDAPLPTSLYGEIKLKAEQFLISSAASDNTSQIYILRFPLVYGIERHGSLHELIAKVLSRKYLPVPNVKNLRSMLYIDNAVNALLCAGRKKSNEVLFFVSDDCAYSTAEIVLMIASAFSHKVRLIKIPAFLLRVAIGLGNAMCALLPGRNSIRPDLYKKLTADALYSNELLKRSLGYQPTVCLDEILPRIADDLKHA